MTQNRLTFLNHKFLTLHYVAGRMMVLLILALGVVGCDEQSSRSTPAPPNQAATTSPTLPAELTARESLPQVDLAALRKIIAETGELDRYLIIDFWATWCSPCVAMFPGVHALGEQYPDKLRVISVTFDAPGKYEQRAIEFLEKHHARADAYLIDPDSDEQGRIIDALADQWQDIAPPAILIFNPQGKLVGEFLEGEVPPIAARLVELVGPAEP